jgi:type IV pilus assembly protein PilN
MIRINLIGTEKKEITGPGPEVPAEVREKKKLQIGPFIFIILAAAIAALYLMQKKELNQEEELLSQAQAQKNQLQDVLSKLDQLEQQKNLLDRKISLIQQLQSQQVVAVTIMDELSKNIPEWVWLTEVSYRNQAIQIKGRGLSNTLVADYMTNLKNSPNIAEISLISTNQRTVRNDQYVEFAMSARYKVPEISETIPEKPLTGGQK